MGKMTVYMDNVELEAASAKILDHMAEAATKSSRILDELDSLKNSILVDGSKVSNKSELVDKSIKNIKTTNEMTLAVFKHVIDMYFDSKDYIHALMDSRIGALKNGK